ncbi:MAG: hypothetical protein H7248_07475 [Microbacteriaceae bacterium]|nr:hypothetical protein [Microbacteriaceae bacterium]
MSDSIEHASQPATDEARLPPAAFEITDYRHAVDLVRTPQPSGRRAVLALVLSVVAFTAVLIGAAVAGVAGGFTGAGVAGYLAVGLVGWGVLLALVGIRPVQLRQRRRTRQIEIAEFLAVGTAEALRLHLSSIGYAVPTAVTSQWINSPDADATSPLVHDSVIASRWWFPAAGDERVFVEPHLNQGGSLSSLPALLGL